MIEVVGYVGSAGAATMWLPQAARAVRHRHDDERLASLSLATYAVALVFNSLLLTYGLVHDARPVVVAGVVNLGCAAVIVTVLGARRVRARGVAA